MTFMEKQIYTIAELLKRAEIKRNPEMALALHVNEFTDQAEEIYDASALKHVEDLIATLEMVEETLPIEENVNAGTLHFLVNLAKSALATLPKELGGKL